MLPLPAALDPDRVRLDARASVDAAHSSADIGTASALSLPAYAADQLRAYVSVEYVFTTNLASMQYPAFFSICRLKVPTCVLILATACNFKANSMARSATHSSYGASAAFIQPVSIHVMRNVTGYHGFLFVYFLCVHAVQCIWGMSVDVMK